MEFHAPVPLPANVSYRLTKEHLMPGKSLGTAGIHARPNPETIALTPTLFDLADGGGIVANIRVAHPLNMALMKLQAMADQWTSAQTKTDRDGQDWHTAQAGKHASDTALAIAMMTEQETAFAPTLLTSIQSTALYQPIRQIAQEYFLDARGWGRDSVNRTWPGGIPTEVVDTLTDWFA